MPIDLTVPSPGESISEVTLGQWHKSDGEWVEKDELLLEIESDKATLELRSPETGLLAVRAETGDEVKVGAVIGVVDPDGERPAGGASEKKSGAKAADSGEGKSDSKADSQSGGKSGGKSDGKSDGRSEDKSDGQTDEGDDGRDADGPRATSVARKLAADQGIDLARVKGTGPGGRITKDDVLGAAESASSDRSGSKNSAASSTSVSASTSSTGDSGGDRRRREVRRERMTRLRQRIAERLVEAQHTAAMLTTFNECDMTEVMRLRKAHKEAFEKAHGVGLGFMSFFVAACVSALQAHPRVNAFIVDGEKGPEVEYHDFVDVAVAVGTDKGLVVPVVRNAESMSFAAVEQEIRDLATRARDGKLSVDEMTGGTFTISNGGVYGSMMSTPILNPPQSAILGMHAIRNRPVEHPDRPGEIALRPMMYLALSYDHRIIDGAEAVGFLVHVKSCIERPERLLLGV